MALFRHLLVVVPLVHQMTYWSVDQVDLYLGGSKIIYFKMLFNIFGLV